MTQLCERCALCNQNYWCGRPCKLAPVKDGVRLGKLPLVANFKDKVVSQLKED